MTDNTPVPLNRTERVLAAMIAAVGGLSLIAIIAVLVVTTAGGTPWPIAVVLPGIGLPLAFVMIIVFAVLSVARRRRLGNGSD